MAKPYCCFFDPKKSYDPHELTDPCPSCGRAYAFPLTEAPTEIGPYRIVQPLERGFYGATYLVERGRLGQRFVLKVIPHAVYRLFNKDFDLECRLHQEVAAGTNHVVRINDAENFDVTFGDVTLPCHVAEMDYVEGPSLETFGKTADARALAQIAIDLFRLMQELENKQHFHNDLHSGNIIIQRLGPDQRRGDAADDSIRAVAVDLGSLADESKSGDRLSDWHSIAKHLFSFGDRLLEQPAAASDLDYRLAALLQEIGNMLSPDVLAQRPPDFAQLGALVREAFFSASSPWREPGPLRSLKDGYNAQTLHWWYVPRILVDPEGEWLARVSTPGPQVITGMRGCGKTMLLRSLQFHARVSAAKMGNDATEPVGRLAEDRFVGLYVPCTRLLDTLGRSASGLHEPYARLFVAYTREAVRAARHLRELDRAAVKPGYDRHLRDAVAQHLRNGGDVAGAENEIELERVLQQVLVSLDRGDARYGLEANPALAFIHLAEAVRACSPLWETAIILYLLDDISTRHLNKDAISELISTLLFSHESCAFKLTTEVQTLEELARSPGLIETARLGRDYDRFDLGGEVNKRLAKPGGKKFIADILRQRAAHYSLHPSADPAQMLGDVPLEQIAREIHAMWRRSAERRRCTAGSAL